MRTTLTLDDDIAIKIERLRKTREMGLKDIVNEALRRGLSDMMAKPRKLEPFRTPVHDGGKPFIDNIDNVQEVLSAIEGDFRK